MISLGSNTSVNLYQVLDLQACDDQTHSIAVYLEGISNAHRFMSALRVAANVKPVVVLKAGRNLAGLKAAKTHSGTIVGSHEVFHAPQRRAAPRWCGAGAVRVRCGCGAGALLCQAVLRFQAPGFDPTASGQAAGCRLQLLWPRCTGSRLAV